MATGKSGRRRRLLTAALLVALPAAVAVQAQAAEPRTVQRMDAIEGQIRALQNELRAMRHDAAARDGQLQVAQRDATRAREEARRAQAAPKPPTRAPHYAGGQSPEATPAAAGGGAGIEADSGQLTAGQQNASTTPDPTPKGTFQLGGVSVTLGGFAEVDGIFRTRNEVADVATNLNTGIPLPNSPRYHESEFRGSARQSRLSLLIAGDVDARQKLAAYLETDFLGASSTANSVESNSYNPRLRQAYATYDDSAWGLHVLGGQAWSLVVPHSVGITPRKENIPLTIDAQFVPGFTWTRQPQLRVVKDFVDHKLWLGFSLESPQATFNAGPNGTGSLAGTPNYQNPGGTFLDPSTHYSNDIAPDIVAKIAWDPGFGHYEAFGLLRFLHDRVSRVGDGRNNTAVAGGVGGSVIVPIIGKMLEFHGNLLAGYGIGRYGTSQLPDATLSQSGAPVPLPEIQALAGLVAHPRRELDLYAYAGTEQAGRRSFAEGGRGFGYGSPLYVNTGCSVELSALPCQANTSGIVQGALGAWWRFLHGGYGTMEAGAQYSYTRRATFPGVGGSPGTDNNTVLVSFRYLPFQ